MSSDTIYLKQHEQTKTKNSFFISPSELTSEIVLSGKRYNDKFFDEIDFIIKSDKYRIKKVEYDNKKINSYLCSVYNSLSYSQDLYSIIIKKFDEITNDLMNMSIFSKEIGIKYRYEDKLDIRLCGEQFDYRDIFVSLFSWSALSTVNFNEIASFLKSIDITSIQDPLAGNGWIGKNFVENGLTVFLSDLHNYDKQWYPVDNIDANKVELKSNCLLLSWIPHENNIGTLILNRFEGKYVIWIGDDMCCGDKTICQVFKKDWMSIKKFFPAQFFGLQDYVEIFKRK